MQPYGVILFNVNIFFKIQISAENFLKPLILTYEKMVLHSQKWLNYFFSNTCKAISFQTEQKLGVF